jgi:rod shape-determining protein MreC
MKKLNFFSYFILIVFLFCLISCPATLTEKIRSHAIAGFFPSWEKSQSMVAMLGASPSSHIAENNKSMELQLENQLLNAQIEGVYEWLLFEERIQEQIERLKDLTKTKKTDLYWNEFFRRRADELRQILEVELQSIPAKVVFRDPNFWSSSIWINVGEKENEILGKTIIAENSPVVVGEALVGVVEYVGYNQSRVRLISDSGVVPSVRAVRGTTQNRSLAQTVKSLESRIYDRDDIISSSDKTHLLQLLSTLKSNLKEEKDDWYLAKGEIYGSSNPLWRSNGQMLKGVGFNYDYADEEGPARDLKTGDIIGEKKSKLKPLPILQKGDLLVTSGMDGIFPSGLHVAIVSKIKGLVDGGYAYDIIAKPVANNLNDLNIVFVIPPLGFNKEEI